MTSRTWLATGAAAVAMVAATSAAAQTPAWYDLPRQPLADSVNAIARQSGVNIVFSSRVTDGRTAPALKGYLTPREAVEKLISKSNLTVRAVDDRNLYLQPGLAEKPAMRIPVAAEAPVRTVQTVDEPPPAPAEASAVSEVVVTGSFIRSRSFKPSSPVDVVTREAIDVRAPTTVADFLRDLPYNVNAGTVPSGQANTSAGGGTVNLRNLGEGATLVLLNSKRQTKLPRLASAVDVNSLVPMIALRNIEVLKDGASALYGSDAVGGVINFLTRDDFKGVELRAQGNFLTYSGKQESRFGAMFGGEAAGTHLMLAVEYNKRDKIFPEDQAFTDGNTNLSTPWNPGRFVVPRRNAAGGLTTTTTRLLDQGCGVTKQTYFFPAGQPNVAADSCYYDFAPDNTSSSGEDRVLVFAQAKHDFAPWLKFKLETAYQKAQVRTTASTSASINVFPSITVPGYNPGVARADADRVAAGLATAYLARNAAGQQLYAVPSAAGSLIPARDAAGNVVLTATPTVASSGIPFYEDLVFEGRILGSQCGLPTNNTLAPGACARAFREAADENDALRFVGSFTGDIGHGWSYDTSLTYSEINDANNAQRNNVLIPQLRAALAGYGGPNCNALTPGQLPGTGNCYFFNPFNNAIYAASGSAAANRWDVIDWLMPAIWDRYKSSITVFDATATGPLFSTPAGEISLATGVQYRKETWAVDFDAAKNTGIVETGTVSQDVQANQVAKAAFVEVAGPVFDSPAVGRLNLNAAVRYEKVAGASTTDPKIGAIYSTPGGRISLRASYGTSFLAPTLFQQFTSSSNIANISDIGPGVRGQDAIRRVTILLQGNPDLSPQRSTAWAVGGVIEPVRNFRVDLSYWHYKFTDLITQENTQALVTANDPVKVIRDAQNNVIFVKPSYVNLASLETAGLDITATYRHDLGRFGQLDASWNSTFVPQFDLRSGPNAPIVKGAGNRNSIITGGVPSPRWRGLGRLTWTMGDHSLTTLIHYYGGINNDTPVSTPGLTKTAGDWYLAGVTTFDLSYTYSPGRIWKAERTSLTLGVQNLFESKPETPFNTTPSFVDPRGRIAYFRVVAGF